MIDDKMKTFIEVVECQRQLLLKLYIYIDIKPLVLI